MGNHERAIKDFEEAIDLDPTCSTAIFHLATSKLKAGHVSQSIQEFKRSEAIEASAAIHDGLGCCYHTAGEFQQAIEAFDKAIKAEPRNIEYLKNRAQCYFDQGNYEDCIADLGKAFEINQRDP